LAAVSYCSKACSWYSSEANCISDAFVKTALLQRQAAEYPSRNYIATIWLP